MSVHDIDSARWLLGGPAAGARVRDGHGRACTRACANLGDVDNGVAICEFADGASPTFCASRTMAHGFEAQTEIVGTEGRLTVGGEARLDHVRSPTRTACGTRCTPTFYERFADAFLREETRVRATRCATTARPPLTLHDATEATRIGMAIQESLRERRVISL